MPTEPLRGFRDYPPPEAGARSEIRRRMRAAARRAGYRELETPCVESLELFQKKSGEELLGQTWSFTDKGNRPVALVPETTPSVARILAARVKSEPLPVKWFTVSKQWRYEEPQAGRTREFTQFNLDIFGVPGVEAEADILGTTALVLDEIGGEGLYAFRVSDRAVTEGLGRRAGASAVAPFFRAIDQYRKISAQEFTDELGRAGVSTDPAEELRSFFDSAGTGVPFDRLEPFLSELSRGLDAAALEGVERIRKLFSLLDRGGLSDRTVFDPTVVRGLAYYTSTVFEGFAKGGEGRSLFGGGRYDQLIELFDGPPTPAAGIAIGDQTLELFLKGASRWPDGEPPLDTYVAYADATLYPEAVALVAELRRAGVSADSDLLGRNLSRQLKEAARRKSRRALILGLREATPGAVVERDLATGAQREVARAEAARSA
jgi:histidyl-tRNA synthetase